MVIIGDHNHHHHLHQERDEQKKQNRFREASGDKLSEVNYSQITSIIAS